MFYVSLYDAEGIILATSSYLLIAWLYLSEKLSAPGKHLRMFLFSSANSIKMYRS